MQKSCAIPYASLFAHQQTDAVIFIFFLCTMHCTFPSVLPYCPFHVSLLYWLHLKAGTVCPFKWFILVAQKFNHRSVKRISFDAYTLHFKIVTFFFGVFFETNVLKGQTKSFKMLLMEFIFRQSCRLTAYNFTESAFL